MSPLVDCGHAFVFVFYSNPLPPRYVRQLFKCFISI